MHAESDADQHVARGGGKMVWFLGQPLEVKITGEQTGGAYGVTEAESAASFSPAPHAHANEAEAIYVVDGDYVITVDGERFEAGPGSLVHIPKGAVHTHKNVGATSGRTLTFYFPAGFEKLFEELGEPMADREDAPRRPADPDALLDRAPAYGLTFPES